MKPDGSNPYLATVPMNNTVAGKIASVMPKPMATPEFQYTDKQKKVLNPPTMATPAPNTLLSLQSIAAAQKSNM